MAENGVVIVGAGTAAAKAAEALREEGYSGPVTLIGAEPDLPYERPPLSKGYLLGTQERDSVFLLPPEWYAENSVEVISDCAARALDRPASEVVLADGRRIGYEKLLLATGSRPRELDVPGVGLPGVHYLRTLSDSDRLRDAFSRATRVAVIGGGWIGLETASAARAAGAEVTIVEMGELPLLRVLGREVAGIFADLHRQHGVDLRLGVSIRRLLGTESLTGVELDDGTAVTADVAVVGVGILPNTEIAAEAGLIVDNGIVVDEHLQTSDPAIWAAGDVAAAYHPVLQRRIRVEHVTNALHQGPAAARSMLGGAEPYADLPFFYSDQYDLGMEYVGFAEPGGYDRVVLRGDVAGLEFVAFWCSAGRVVAAMHVNLWDAIDPLRALVASGRTIASERLGDSSIPLDEL